MNMCFFRLVFSKLLITIILSFLSSETIFSGSLRNNKLTLGRSIDDLVTITDHLPTILQEEQIFPSESEIGINNVNYVSVFLPSTGKNLQEMGIGTMNIEVGFKNVITGRFLGPTENLVSTIGGSLFTGINNIANSNGNVDSNTNVFSYVKVLKNPFGPSLYIYEGKSIKPEINAYNAVDPVTFEPIGGAILGIQYEEGDIIIDGDIDSKVFAANGGAVSIGHTQSYNDNPKWKGALNVSGNIEFNRFFGMGGGNSTAFVWSHTNSNECTLLKSTTIFSEVTCGGDPFEKVLNPPIENGNPRSEGLHGMVIFAILNASVYVEDDTGHDSDATIELVLSLIRTTGSAEVEVASSNITGYAFEGDNNSTNDDCPDEGCSPLGNFMSVLTYKVEDTDSYKLELKYKFLTVGANGNVQASDHDGKILSKSAVISIFSLKASHKDRSM